MSEKRYCMINDDDGHTFIIGVEKKEEFERLLWESDDDCEAFNNRFRSLSWHPNAYTFTDPRDPDGNAYYPLREEQ